LGLDLEFEEGYNCSTYLRYKGMKKQIEERLHQYWILISSVYILLMQLGFLLVEVGQVRKTN